MKFGMTHKDKELRRYDRIAKSSREGPEKREVFAWLPKKCKSGVTVWLEPVMRHKNYLSSHDSYYYSYHEIEGGTK